LDAGPFFLGYFTATSTHDVAWRDCLTVYYAVYFASGYVMPAVTLVSKRSYRGSEKFCDHA
jgi:hypothetical protein